MRGTGFGYARLNTRPDETEAFGQRLASVIPSGTIIALYGNLAAGKTCFVHGFAKAFNVAEPVNSPTFTIINEYHGTQTLFHLDLYRLTTVAEVYDLGYEDLFDSPQGICLVEWPERADSVLPKERIDIRMSHKSEDAREITVEVNLPLLDGWEHVLNESSS